MASPKISRRPGACAAYSTTAATVVTLAGVLALLTPAAPAQQTANRLLPSQAQQIQRAIRAAQAGDDQRALALTNTLLRDHPAFVPALKLQGELLEEEGRNAD